MKDSWPDREEASLGPRDCAASGYCPPQNGLIVYGLTRGDMFDTLD